MHSLPLFMRLNDRPVIVAGDGKAAESKRRLLERAGARIVKEHEDALLAVVAIEDDEAARQLVGDLKRRGIPVNAVDRPELCDFTLPAIIDRDPVLIAIGTGGASAGLAKELRQRLERILPASLGALAKALSAARGQIRTKWPDGSVRRRQIGMALAQGGALDPFRNPEGGDVTRWLDTPGDGGEGGLHIIPVRSPDADDLTIRQSRLLGEADLVWFDPGISPDILARARADAQRQEARPGDEVPRTGLTIWLRREAGQ
jgi:uroporphyrin-III C-methyltransferase/precorrin-2 dehydrogenase/sirohydrochlorin ferrochelatase